MVIITIIHSYSGSSSNIVSIHLYSPTGVTENKNLHVTAIKTPV